MLPKKKLCSFGFLIPLLVLCLRFPVECGMRDAVSGTALILRFSLASHMPRCSPINNYSITMHPTFHSRCGPCDGGKREGEKQGERQSHRMDRPERDEHMTARDVLLADAVETQCCILCQEQMRNNEM